MNEETRRDDELRSEYDLSKLLREGTRGKYASRYREGMIMKPIPDWYYDEASHSGVNYSSREVVDGYDDQHTRFRDFRNEAARIVQALDINKDDVVIDMGCGSGELALCLAGHCSKVFAVDISPQMIDLCRRKISQRNIDNVYPVCGGLLSYRHDGEPVDAVISSVVLHHLPDFWKLIALRNINSFLKPGGRFFLFDIVFSFPVEESEESIDHWLNEMREKAGETLMEESIVHVKEEFSSWDWIIDQMLELAGFDIAHTSEEMPNAKAYVCVKRFDI